MKNINKLHFSIYTFISIFIIICIWELICIFNIVPTYMLPSPLEVLEAMKEDRHILLIHTAYTLKEALFGLIIGTILGFILATLMDRFKRLHKFIYPILIVSQTIPTVAIAPLLVLWLGYEILPKVILVVLVTFFPIAMGLLEGYLSTDRDLLELMRSMGAKERSIFRHIKFPYALSHFFSGLKISSAYAIVGAVISEWLGGFYGLGVYMIRVKKSFAFDKMFAVIIIISILSLILMKLVDFIRNRIFIWED